MRRPITAAIATAILATATTATVRGEVLFRLAATEGVSAEGGGTPPDGGRVARWRAESTRFQFGRSAATRRPRHVAAEGALEFDGEDDGFGQIDATRIARTIRLPDRPGSAPGKGFTCTGIAPDGSGGIWVVNYGYSTRRDARPRPELVRLSPSGETLAALDLRALEPTIDRVQGLTRDSTRDSLWLVASANARAYQITSSGDLAGSIALDPSPNGIAHDPVTDLLHVLYGDGSCKSYRPGEGVPAGQLPPLPGRNADHLSLHDGVLTASRGKNGSPIELSTYWLGGGDDRWRRGAHMQLDALSAEGLIARGGKIVVANDGFFHSTSPALNQVLEFESALVLTPFARATVLAAVRLTRKSPTARCLFAVGDPIRGPGFGLYVPGEKTGTVRVYANSTPGETGLEYADFRTTGLLEGYSLIRADFDFARGAVRVAQNGGAVGTMALERTGAKVFSPVLSIGDNLLDRTNRALPMRLKGLALLRGATDSDLRTEEALFAAKHAIGRLP